MGSLQRRWGQGQGIGMGMGTRDWDGDISMIRVSLPRRWAAQGRSAPRWMGTAAWFSAPSSRSSTGAGSARPPTRWPASAPPPRSTSWVSGGGGGGGCRAPKIWGCGRFGNAPGLWLSELPPSHVVSLLLWVPGTSPHAVTNVSVLPLLLAANISWEPGFDGGYFQRFSVWYTPL